jgi:predicted nucleic acid-binding protein
VFLIDTNVWLELLLEQENSNQVRVFLDSVDADQLAISEFSIYSIAIILTRLKKDEVFQDFLSDTIEDSGIKVLRLDAAGLKQALAFGREFHLDFDDAYQYAAASQHDLVLISFDSDFDKTKLGRKIPSKALP